MINLVVTGTGRCGTTYLAKLLTSLHYFCGHESIFNYEDEEIIKKRLLNKDYTLSICSQSTANVRFHEDKMNWVNLDEIKADSSYMAAPYLNWKELSNIKIIHLYRNPLDVIRSFVHDLDYFSKNHPNEKNIYNELGFEQKIWKFLPLLSDIDNQLERACYFYIEWNKLITKNCKNKKVLEIKIEDDDKIQKIKKFINIKENFDYFDDKKENTRNIKNKKIKLKEIPSGKIKDKIIEIMFEKKYLCMI